MPEDDFFVLPVSMTQDEVEKEDPEWRENEELAEDLAERELEEGT